MPETKLDDINIKINEDADKCCLVIPIDAGVKIVGVLVILGAARFGWAAFNFWGGSLIFSIVYMIMAVPVFYAAFLFIKFFQKDTSETRADLPKACIFVVFSAIACAIWFLVFFMILSGYSYGGAFYGQWLAPEVFYIVTYLYYAGVCKRYAK